MLREWPICPRPEHDESLSSWIERVGREYGMSATALLKGASYATVQRESESQAASLWAQWTRMLRAPRLATIAERRRQRGYTLTL